MRRMIRVLVPLAVLAAGCPTTSPAPSITEFKATPATIHAGEKTTLSWTVAGSTSVSIDPGVTVPSGASSVDVTPTATTTYTLTATGLGGSVTATATVTVLPAVAKPAITAFTASPSAAVSGGSVTLSWTVTGQVDSIKVDPGNISVLTDTNTSTGAGSRVMTGVTPPVTYTLTATNAGGSDAKTASVALSTGKHLQYTDPTLTTAKLKLVRNATSTDTHLILDMKVGAAAVTAFGVAVNIPFDPASAGMLSFPASGLIAGAINFGASPATAAAKLGDSTSAMPSIFSVGVAKKKASAADGDDTWAAGATLFSIAFDMNTSTATGGTNVFTAAALGTNAKFRAAALKKDGSEAVSKADIAIGDLIISN